MFKFNRILASSLAATVLFLSATAIAQSDQTRVIRLGYGLAEQTNQGRAAKVFADMVEKNSNGKMKVQAMGAAALGSDVKMQQALIDGTQEMMVGSTATLVSIAKEMALWDTPFLFSNFKEADALLDGPIGTRVMENLPEKGLVGLAYWENGFRNLTNSKRAINRMEDLNGVNLRVMQNTVFLDSFKTLGANTVPMSFSELFGALESKKVDGQENPFNTILSSKFYDVQKYLTLTNHVYSPWIMLVSKKWWDKLSAVDQKILKSAAIASRDFERQDTRNEASNALNALKTKGMKVNELGVGETYRMRNKLTKVYSKIGQDVGITLWIDAQNELFNIRSKTQ
ncbi:MAG: TRAP transporter substrate-binding protein [Methylococcales bacterium]